MVGRVFFVAVFLKNKEINMLQQTAVMYREAKPTRNKTKKKNNCEHH